MDYIYIENLVKKSKANDKIAQEKLLKEFEPFILNISSKTHLNGYDFDDIKSECYKSIAKCLVVYNEDRHRFVAYTINAIKNNLKDLIKSNFKKSSITPCNIVHLTDELESVLKSDDINLDELIINKIDCEILNLSLKKLTPYEQELIEFIFIKGYSLKTYSELKHLSYNKIYKDKQIILDKIHSDITSNESLSYTS
ncbi:MAG: sigma-70 family RNA polymerase sigma factor [Clostridium butyricum]|nr:sigma-70 family RNA polymerase sigma factor [Clostridium butyricum]